MARGWVGRRIIAYEAGGESYKTKTAALAAGNAKEALTPVRDPRYKAAHWIADPATGARKLQWVPGSFKTKAEGEAALKQLVREVDENRFVPPTKLRLREFLVEQWFPSVAASLRPTTVQMYRTYADAHIIPRLGGTQLRALKPQALNAMYADLLSNGRRDGKGGLSPRSVRLVHVVLHRSLQDAVKWRLVPSNVASDATPPDDEPDEKDVWSPAEVAKFLQHVEGNRLATLWHLLAATGLRRGEVLGLRWRDIDLDRKTLTVNQAVVVINHRPVVTPRRAKTKSSRRTIALDTETVSALRRHQVRQGEERLAWGPGYNPGGLAFCREDGALIHPEWLTKAFDRHRKAAGLPPASLHGLRHSHATALLQSGVPLRTVSGRLGHRSPTVTLAIYSHLLDGDDAAAAEVGARLLAGGR